MDIILAIVTVIIIVSIWVKAGADGLTTSSSGGFNDVWRTNSKRKIRRKSSDITMESRMHALAAASSFLKSYKDPMGELCLANENCKVNLVLEGNKQKKIVCISKVPLNSNTRKILTAVAIKDFETFYNLPFDEVVDNLFDLICENFTYTTVYENIFSALTTGMLDVKESVITIPKQKNKTQKVYDSVTNTSIRTNNLLNINTATEAELSALPGVNIVTAKKTIKYIESNGQFETVDEFIEKMKIKDVFAEQIRNIVCTKIDDTEEPQKTNENQGGNLDLPDDDFEDGFVPHSENERTIDL